MGTLQYVYTRANLRTTTIRRHEPAGATRKLDNLVPERLAMSFDARRRQVHWLRHDAADALHGAEDCERRAVRDSARIRGRKIVTIR